MTDYSQHLIKTYRYWEVYVAGNQSMLGRCTIWCPRQEALDLVDATPDEQAELFVVLSELRAAASRLFFPDWFNYSFLGNETRHLHGHFLPRYAVPRTFLGTVFVDGHYGEHYQTDHDFEVTPRVLNGIRDAYRHVLGRLTP